MSEAKAEDGVEMTDVSPAPEPAPEPVPDPGVVTKQPKGKRKTNAQSFHADDAKYPVPLYCSVCCHCQKDMPLCCYALWCPMCLFAEIAEQLGQGACCANFCLVFWAGGCTTICLQTCMNLSGLFCPLAPLVNLVPCIICVNRHVLHHKDFLPKSGPYFGPCPRHSLTCLVAQPVRVYVCEPPPPTLTSDIGR